MLIQFFRVVQGFLVCVLQYSAIFCMVIRIRHYKELPTRDDIPLNASTEGLWDFIQEVLTYSNVFAISAIRMAGFIKCQKL